MNISAKMHEFYLVTKKFTLRPFRTSDASAIRKNIQDQAIFDNTLKIPQPYLLKHAKEHIAKNLKQYRMKNPANIGFVIDVRNQAVGAIGATFRGSEVEIGYWLAKRYRGRGIMTQVVKLLSGHLLSAYHEKKIIARVFTTNTPSARVLIKAGFRRQRLVKNAEKKDGHLVDVIEFTKRSR